MKILDNIFSLLDNDLIYNEIDLRVDCAMKSFEIKFKVNNHKEFNIIITSLVKHIYQHGLSVQMNLTETKALEEAIWILEKYYRGEHTSGYDDALFDAINQEQYGIEFVIEIIVELIKSLEREKYIYSVLTKNIDPRDWNLRKKLVEEIINRFSDLLPSELKELTSSQLTPYLEQLIKQFANTSHAINNYILT